LKGFFKNIQNLLIIVLVIILLVRSCGGGGDTISEPKTITKVVVRYDTVQTIVEKYIPRWRDRVITKIDTFSSPVDTIAILKDYYAKYVYTDTLRLGTVGYAVVNDTITRNSIFSRDVATNILVPTITQTNTVFINEREFYWGASVIGRLNQIDYLGGGLLYKTKNKKVYGFGAGINQNFQPVVSASLYWKIGK